MRRRISEAPTREPWSLFRLILGTLLSLSSAACDAEDTGGREDPARTATRDAAERSPTQPLDSRADAPPAQAHLVAASQLVQGAIDRGEIPGAVILAGRGGEVHLESALGSRALLPEPEGMTVDTLFDLASLTKPMATAAAVLWLRDRGRLGLTDTASTHLPEFTGSGKEAITVEQLLRHTSGLIADNALADYADGPRLAWTRICDLELLSEPGLEFRYTDVGFLVLQKLVERIDGRPLDRLCAEEIFGPLGMSDTGFLPDPTIRPRCAPTERRGERWMRGEVHDPRAHALGGVAGHAGLFGSAQDVGRFCQALLAGGALGDARVWDPGTVAEWTRPRWLGDGSSGRALGLDVDSGYSSVRGDRFPAAGGFGHTGFTGTAFWADRASQAWFVLLAHRVHPDGEGRILALRRAVATEIALAYLGPSSPAPTVKTGIDVLVEENFGPLRGQRVALLTNATGLDVRGRRTIDLLLEAPEVEVVRILSPEHGFGTNLDQEDVPDGVDGITGLPIASLYGETRRPTPEMLEGIETLVFDVQGAGVRFYTYGTTLAYAMEECSRRGIRVLVLDRPNPIGGEGVLGPCADSDRLSFIAHAPIPLVHGMTLGELARFYASDIEPPPTLEVVAMEGWERGMDFLDTGLPWRAPSPNLRNPTQAWLYPAIGLLEATNLSVGRGTDQPFEQVGAPWLDGRALARRIATDPIPGLRCTAIEFTPSSSRFEGEACGGLYLRLEDPDRFDPVRAGFRIATHLRALHPREFEARGLLARLSDFESFSAWMEGKSYSELEAAWAAEQGEFHARRAPCLLYP